MSKKHDMPEMIEITPEEMEAIKHGVKNNSLTDGQKSCVLKCIDAALWLVHVLEQTKITLHKLRCMVFGKGYKNKNKSQDNSKDDKADKKTNPTYDVYATQSSVIDAVPPTTSKKIEASVNSPAADTVTTDVIIEKDKKPGHGRMPHTVYKNFIEVMLKVSGFKACDQCPQLLCSGILYLFNLQTPKVFVHVKGRNFAYVYKYIVEQLRCNLCHYVLQADIPPEVGTEKYDPSFKAWIALQKYFVATPFYRQENFQKMLGFPLPDATQWDLIEQLAGDCYQIFDILCLLAANSKVASNDDSWLRIQEVIAEIKNNPDIERRGMYTTCIMAENDGHKIALFLNGTNHSGENMQALLERREADKPPIIQMCDALPANIPKKIATIACNCLSHGFRKFDEIVDYFPTSCVTIMKLIGLVYEFDEQTKAMDDNARLEYHQIHSKPVMEQLSQYMQALFAEKLAEPNSELRKALKYMQKHWEKLTRFLTVAGAPLDTNIVERALKISIRNRKNSMFYRTRYSAQIGGMVTSIIYTFDLNDV